MSGHGTNLRCRSRLLIVWESSSQARNIEAGKFIVTASLGQAYNGHSLVGIRKARALHDDVNALSHPCSPLTSTTICGCAQHSGTQTPGG